MRLTLPRTCSSISDLLNIHIVAFRGSRLENSRVVGDCESENSHTYGCYLPCFPRAVVLAHWREDLGYRTAVELE